MQWIQEKNRSNGRKSQEMIRNTIAENFANRIDSTNLFLLLDEIKKYTNDYPTRTTSRGGYGQDGGQSNARYEKSKKKDGLANIGKYSDV